MEMPYEKCDGCGLGFMEHRLAYDTENGGRIGATIFHYRIECLDSTGESRPGRTFNFCPDCYAPISGEFIPSGGALLHKLSAERTAQNH